MRTAGMLAVAFAAAVLSSACTTGGFRGATEEVPGCPVKVEAFAAPDADSKGKIYYLAPANKDVKGDDPQFVEFAGYIENALSERGYKRVSAEKGADLLVRLGYGVGEPQVSTRIYTTSYGYAYPLGWMQYVVTPEKNRSGEPVRTKHLMVEAYDLRSPGRSPTWKVSASSHYGSKAIHEVFPYLTVAAVPYFGKRTGKGISVNIRGDDPRLDALRR